VLAFKVADSDLKDGRGRAITVSQKGDMKPNAPPAIVPRISASRGEPVMLDSDLAILYGGKRNNSTGQLSATLNDSLPTLRFSENLLIGCGNKRVRSSRRKSTLTGSRQFAPIAGITSIGLPRSNVTRLRSLSIDFILSDAPGPRRSARSDRRSLPTVSCRAAGSVWLGDGRYRG
jgi:hypothetical protein